MATIHGPGISLDIRGDVKDIIRDLDHVERKIVPAATVSALNKTGTRIMTRARKRIAKAAKLDDQYQIAIPLKLLKKKLAMGKANKRRRSVALYVKNKPINAARLNMSGTKKGVKVKGKLFPGTWGFGPGWVTKKGKRFPKGIVLRRQGKARYPTEALHIRIWPQGNQIMTSIIKRMGRAAFRRLFRHEVSRRLDKKSPVARAR